MSDRHGNRQNWQQSRNGLMFAAAFAELAIGLVFRTMASCDRIVEPQGVYRLANGQLVISRACQ